MTDNPQPRPDLDAAIDAVVPSLTAVSDDAAAASLRRTRLALAERPGARRASALGWGFAAAAVAGTVVLVGVNLWQREAPAGQDATVPRAAASASPVPAARPIAPAAPERIASEPATPQRARRERPVHATTPTDVSPVTPGPDPLVALVRAVQRIPEDAWQKGTARVEQSLVLPEVSLPPIVVAPLDTPPLGDQVAEPLAPGEP